MSAAIGRTLGGRFQLTAFIGEGAMANVYRGRDLHGGADVAIKILMSHLAGDPTFAARFRREAKTASMLSHPGCVRIYEYGADADLLYIAMELIEGRDLKEILQLERRLDFERAARLLIDVFDVLDHAHQQGVVHRDLKPENVMVVQTPGIDGSGLTEIVKVLDFGIAKLLSTTRDSMPSSDPQGQVLTRAGMALGTPAYMSPEQCKGDAVDARSDLYTCGILLYELVTGRSIFESENPFEVAAMQVKTAPRPAREHVPELPLPFDSFILSLLAKSPNDRPESAARAKSELQMLLQGSTASMHVPSLIGEMPSAPPRAPTATASSFPVAPPVAPIDLDADRDSEIPTETSSPALPGPVNPSHPPAIVDARPASGSSSWIVVALAILAGVVLGSIAFALAR